MVLWPPVPVVRYGRHWQRPARELASDHVPSRRQRRNPNGNRDLSSDPQSVDKEAALRTSSVRQIEVGYGDAELLTVERGERADQAPNETLAVGTCHDRTN